MTGREALLGATAVLLGGALLLAASAIVDDRRRAALPQAPPQPMTAADLTPLRPLLTEDGLPRDTHEDDAP